MGAGINTGGCSTLDLIGTWQVYMSVRTDNVTALGGMTTPPAYFGDICPMVVTDLGSGQVGLTGLSCQNISWNVSPTGNSAQPVITTTPGLINPATTCSFTVTVHDSNAGAAGSATAAFQFSLDSTRHMLHGLATPTSGVGVSGSNSPAFLIDFSGVQSP
jgi:hypothetical protein